MAIEEVEGTFNRIRSYFGIISVHNTLTVRGCLSEVAPDVPAMRRVLVDHQLDRSSFVLLLLQPRDTILRWSLGIKVAHLHQKRHHDLGVRHKINVYRSATWNPKVTKKADRIIRYDCAEDRLALWSLVETGRQPQSCHRAL